MEVRIKTNKERLKLCRWEKTEGGVYQKQVGNKLFKVGYKDGYICDCDMAVIGPNPQIPDRCYIYLKDIRILLGELEVLKVKRGKRVKKLEEKS